MVAINRSGNLLPIPDDLPDRDEARRHGFDRYRDDRYPCKQCGNPAPVRYRANDACTVCINTRPRSR